MFSLQKGTTETYSAMQLILCGELSASLGHFSFFKTPAVTVLVFSGIQNTKFKKTNSFQVSKCKIGFGAGDRCAKSLPST